MTCDCRIAVFNHVRNIANVPAVFVQCVPVLAIGIMSTSHKVNDNDGIRKEVDTSRLNVTVTHVSHE